MFLDKKKFFSVSVLKHSLLKSNNNFLIIDFISNEVKDKNLIYFLNIRRLKVKKFFFKANYYLSFEELDFVYYLNLILEFANNIFLNGIIFNNQYLNINDTNIKDYYYFFLNVNANFLYFYLFFFNIVIILSFFLKKLIFLLIKLC